MSTVTAAEPGSASVDVVELNPYAPRPFVFTDLALCLRDSIQRAGWHCTHRFNDIDPGAISVVLGALPPFSPRIRQLDRRKTLVANFEQMGSRSALASKPYEKWLRNRVVLDYHSRNIDHLRRVSGGAQRAFEIPIVPGPSIVDAAQPLVERSVDVLFYGSPTRRRDKVLERLRRAGMTVETVAGAYGAELAPAVQRARLVLHLHYYETGLFPVARVLQPIANRVPVVCETSALSALSDWSRSGILFAPYREIVDACRALLDSPAEQARRAEATLEFAETLDFTTPFGSALQALDPAMRAPSQSRPGC